MEVVQSHELHSAVGRSWGKLGLFWPLSIGSTRLGSIPGADLLPAAQCASLVSPNISHSGADVIILLLVDAKIA